MLLDYAGCKSHWSDQGITADVNVGKLLEMVGEGKKVWIFCISRIHFVIFSSQNWLNRSPSTFVTTR